MQNEKRIGWLGAGRMGAAMVTRLLNDDTRVTAWNRTAAKAAPLIDKGAELAETIADLTRCDIVFISVTSSPDLREAALGSGGLLSGEQTPSIVVDTSTASADTASEVCAAAKARGTGFLSAPISDNPAMVATATRQSLCQDRTRCSTPSSPTSTQ